MRVRIVETSGSRVRFKSDSGEGFATWVGAMPALGHLYDVELDSRAIRRWGSPELAVAAERWVGVRITGGTTVVQGYLESVEDDGHTVLRLGRSSSDPILVLETRGIAPASGSLVLVQVADLQLFDENL